MKRFEFRLSSVVRLREMQLRVEEAKLEKLLAERAKIEASLKELKSSVHTSWGAAAARPNLRGSDFTALQACKDYAERQSTITSNQLASQEPKIREQRGTVTELRRGLRLLEKLKENQKREWQAEADREMAALVDDVTSAKRAAARIRSTDDGGEQMCQIAACMQSLPSSGSEV